MSEFGEKGEKKSFSVTFCVNKNLIDNVVERRKNMRKKKFFDKDGRYQKDYNNRIKATGNSSTVNSVYKYLGEVDASKIWRDDKDLAKRMFLHTEAYREFLNDEALILLGRTGVGKTAILFNTEDYMRENTDSNYINTVVINVDCYKLLADLSNCTELTTMNNMTISLEVQRIIRMFIETAIMQEIVSKTKRSNNEHFKRMEAYLSANGFAKVSGWESFISVFSTAAEGFNSDSSKLKLTLEVATSLNTIIKKLRYTGYDEAQSALSKYLENENGRAVVLIDSLNEYNVNNRELIHIVKGLIETCFYYYNNPSSRIKLKIALPSEIYNKVLIRLPSKQSGNTVVIRWKYKELVVFLALRIYAIYKTRKSTLSGLTFCEKFNGYEDFYADISPNAYENAMELINNILPSVCPTSLSYSFLTLPYCLRHTLKKPREVIHMFNAIFDEIVKHKDINYFKNHPEKIRETVHRTQDYMIQSALSMYASTYASIYVACKSVVYENDFIFNGKEIENRIKKAITRAKVEEFFQKTTSDYIENDIVCLDATELKQILIESGLLGKISKFSEIKAGNPQISNEEDICVLSVDFDFKISATAGAHIFDEEDQYVFHPMCYENYNCYIDKNTLVYPAGDDDSDTIISTIVSADV